MRSARWLVVLPFASLPLFAQYGAPVASFGTGGIVSTDYLGGTDKASAVAVDREGRVIVAGFASEPADEEWDTPPNPDPRRWFALARYARSGELDPSFGVGGKVLTPIRDHAFATAVLATRGGRIVAAGYACGAANGSGCDFAAARYLPDGTLDPSFGAGGVATVSFPGAAFSYARAAALLPGGGILLAGNAGAAVALARLRSDGSLDTSFGEGGLVTTAVPPQVTLTAVAATSDGRVAATAAGLSEKTALLLRYLPDGSLDPSFGAGGRVTADLPGATFTALSIAPGGKLLVGGGLEVTDPLDGRPRDHFLLARYGARGAPDTSFGARGFVAIDVSTAYAAPWAPVRGGSVRSLHLLSGGLVAAAGTVWTDLERARFGTAFVDSAGRLATGVGAGGVVATDVRGTIAEAGGLALLPSGVLVLAGASQRVAERADQSFDWSLAAYEMSLRYSASKF